MKQGDVVQLGNHRLMCGDAGNPKHVAKLFKGIAPDLVFTSPPYLQQRQYDRAIDCWDTMMQRVFSAMPWHDTTQVLVNLGLVHRKGEWLPYWDGWIEWMREQGWRRHALSVWDKGVGVPLDPRIGRLYPSFELIFQFQKSRRVINRITRCVTQGTAHSGTCLREGNGKLRSLNPSRKVMSHRVPDDVWRIGRQKNHKTKHPAVFPIALPVEIMKAYADAGQIVYDPFCGSGTSIIAGHQTGRVAYGMEISSAYCDIAVERIRKAMAQPQQGTLALCTR